MNITSAVLLTLISAGSHETNGDDAKREQRLIVAASECLYQVTAHKSIIGTLIPVHNGKIINERQRPITSMPLGANEEVCFLTGSCYGKRSLLLAMTTEDKVTRKRKHLVAIYYNDSRSKSWWTREVCLPNSSTMGPGSIAGCLSADTIDSVVVYFKRTISGREERLVYLNPCPSGIEIGEFWTLQYLSQHDRH